MAVKVNASFLRAACNVLCVAGGHGQLRVDGRLRSAAVDEPSTCRRPDDAVRVSLLRLRHRSRSDGNALPVRVRRELYVDRLSVSRPVHVGHTVPPRLSRYRRHAVSGDSVRPSCPSIDPHVRLAAAVAGAGIPVPRKVHLPNSDSRRDRYEPPLSHTRLLPNALAETVMRSVVRPSVRLSVRLFPLYLSNRLTFELEILCVGHDHNSPGIEGQGQRSRSTRSV